MLSYRHGYHAGNAADVLKHFILFYVLDYVKKKIKILYLLTPMLVLENILSQILICKKIKNTFKVLKKYIK